MPRPLYVKAYHTQQKRTQMYVRTHVRFQLQLLHSIYAQHVA